MDPTLTSNLNSYFQGPTQNGSAGYLGSSTALGGGSSPLGSNFFGNNSGLGFNAQTLQLALGGLSAVGNFWNAFQANKLAKDQFSFTKDITETNLANQTKAYNTSLSDKINARASMNGMSDASVKDYISKNSL